MATVSLEELLRRLRDKAALLRHCADASAVAADQPPDRASLSGMADTCQELEEGLNTIRKVLSVDVLGLDIRR